ncbi:glycosyltransferase family 2 protein [Pelosinus fermentans]|uniref:Glycosyl transferase family 2 n=1 Tax=Pelosinus fermentans JBW45 TaxID=1192197 RepID=I9NNK4_9FIRM|nr:glycosyltransferase family 2 protein [Pelosinus fermentans]AJQ26015.1 glycosyl transferase family 2 [Pelosinus fermentans JBW45]
MNKKVYIVILNWNGWKDTIECLESVFRNQYSNYKVIVCDNASSDGSLDKIKQWADGKLKANISDDSRIAIHTSPMLEKPIRYIEYTRENAESGVLKIDEPPLILIQTGENLGFAGGNNVGIKYALARNDFDYIWLLNNDTVIKPDSMIHLLQRIQEQPSVGMCGSTLLYYHQPEKVQALGGATYNKWLGISKHLSAYEEFNNLINSNKIEKQMDYIIGASMFVSKKFIEDIGLISEDYFLYYEEIDWVIRASGKYNLGYAPKSIVYHKEGATIGSSSASMGKSSLADYFAVKSRLIFTKKFFSYTLPTVYLGLLIVIFNRIRRKQWDRVEMILKIIIDR